MRNHRRHAPLATRATRQGKLMDPGRDTENRARTNRFVVGAVVLLAIVVLAAGGPFVAGKFFPGDGTRTPRVEPAK